MATPLQFTNLQTLRSCRLCIVCAKSTEAIQIKDNLHLHTKIAGRDVADLPPGARGHDFWLGNFSLHGKSNLSYYVMSLSRQGIQSRATEAAALFTILRPAYSLLVGTCAALGGQGYSCEDVIFGEKALNYEEGNWKIENGAAVFSADAHILKVGGECIEGFVQQAEREDWKYGDFISGCAVRMDAAHILDRVRKTQLRNVGALEMEASGVEALGIIKGVSDMGDERKGLGHWAHYKPAVRNATEATKSFVKWKLQTTIDEKPDISSEPGVILAMGYVENYILKVVQKLLERNKIDAGDGWDQGNPNYHPKANKAVYFDDSRFTVEAIYKEHQMLEVSLPGGSRSIFVRVKGNYVFDLPTTLGSSLSNHPNQVGQVEYFIDILKRRIESHENFIEVIDWDSFIALSEELNG
ncbi:uncharacterized protein F4822DRAFT_429113 [Hypoxylon trugodes]|uniref:uncharacterized protein n=1 Tax=Hypoxylon trugodes TaxID=326681 RepID=UPI0021A12D84|nr:uncharacterized protein F4822DRAFT_429113 [Hypoxylon trugodes]KAI1388494.1 hypothetical protein F4822DRAFT_429113 [Hypoxylon trugodes]